MIRLRALLPLCLALASAAPVFAETQEPVAAAKVQQPAAEDLLELANSAFARMPLQPHVKNRGRGQMSVVDACLEAGLPDLALEIGKTIPDWRRGLAHVRCAFWREQNGKPLDTEQLLAVAQAEVDSLRAQDAEQAWRAERILAVIARVRFLRGETEAFAKASENVSPAEGAGIQEDAALRIPDDAFAKWIEQVDAVIDSQQFEAIQSTLQTCAKLYRHHFADAKKRDELEQRVVSGYSKLPLPIRLRLLVEIGRVAADAGDAVKTLQICGHADRVLAQANWRAEDRVHALADVAALLSRGGERKLGTEQLDAAAALYAEKRSSILDIYRAGPLRSLAEAAAAMGETERALEFWRGAAEAGIENPNSRPRADDLAATCISLVKSKVMPDKKLWSRLREIEAGLGAPW